MIPAARPEIGDEERAAVDRVMRSGMLAQGPEVAAFETEFSAIVDGLHCVAVNSGTSALHLAFLAAGVGAGDEVIVPSFTWVATANAVIYCGAKPVFADVQRDTFNIDPAEVKRKILLLLPPLAWVGFPIMEEIRPFSSSRVRTE